MSLVSEFNLNSKPILSICIPTYNRHERLDLLLQSIARQIEQDQLQDKVEIIVSDNASSDRTREVGESWALRHSFIRLFRNSWNIGGEPNCLRTLEKATGQFAWILGDDDRVREGGIQSVLDHLTSGVTQLFLNFRCVDHNGKCLVASRLDPAMPDDLNTVEVIKRVGFTSVFALISSHVFNREMFLANDAEFLLKLSPWYVLNTGLLRAFHNRPCHLVREPVVDYTVGNERLPPETAVYNRVIQLLRTLRWLEEYKIIDTDFLYGCYELGAGDALAACYFREELYGGLIEISRFWTLPGKDDWKIIRDFIRRGPGFWGCRHQLSDYFSEDFEYYLRHRKPVIHYWHGKAWVPGFSILLSSDNPGECLAFDQLMGKWPEEFAHESILISRVPEEEIAFENLDVFMAPFHQHRSPCAAINSGFRKVLAPRVLVLNEVCSPAMETVIDWIDSRQATEDAPASCLLFDSFEDGVPSGLLGLYLVRDDLADLGAFENYFSNWSRQRLLADAAFRLGSGGWAMNGGEISREALAGWFAAELPAWLRATRALRKRPFSEHGLNLSFRAHLRRLRNGDN
jgi:abequosyltransferase